MATQPDLGIILITSGVFVLFLGGISWAFVASCMALLAAAAWPMAFVLLITSASGFSLLNPESDKLGAGWNIIQSKTAIGSGGFEGKGWLLGARTSIFCRKATDFIIAVLAEEHGLRGVLLLLLLYSLIIGRGVDCPQAKHSSDACWAGVLSSLSLSTYSLTWAWSPGCCR